MQETLYTLCKNVLQFFISCAAYLNSTLTETSNLSIESHSEEISEQNSFLLTIIFLALHLHEF